VTGRKGLENGRITHPRSPFQKSKNKEKQVKSFRRVIAEGLSSRVGARPARKKKDWIGARKGGLEGSRGEKL